MKNKVSIEDILSKVGSDRNKFIKELEREEQIELSETMDDISKYIEMNKLKTETSKKRLIEELKNGLGDRMFEVPIEKEKTFLEKIFTLFNKK